MHAPPRGLALLGSGRLAETRFCSAAAITAAISILPRRSTVVVHLPDALSGACRESMQSLNTARRVRTQKRVFTPRSQSKVVLYDLHDRIVTYKRAWQWQKERAHAIASGEHAEQAVLLLQHAPVYTLGTRSTLENVKFDPENPPHPIFRTERGGEVTYHGPGQLVIYPILDLRQHGKDLHAYLRQLEDIIIEALRDVSGIAAHREEGLTGKIAAIGIRATRWVSYHGAALNIDVDLEPFASIVPCGIQDRDVTSVVKHISEAGMSTPPPHAQLIDTYSQALVQAFENCFDASVTSVRHSLDA